MAFVARMLQPTQLLLVAPNSVRSLSLLEQNHPRSAGHFWSLSQVISVVSQSGHNSFVLA